MILHNSNKTSHRFSVLLAVTISG